LCALDELPPEGRGHFVLINKRMLGIFRDGESIRVMDDTCPHAGASLSAGPTQDGCVVCPWHGWEFDLKTGKCPDNPEVAVRTYPVRLHDSRVQAQLPATCL